MEKEYKVIPNLLFFLQMGVIFVTRLPSFAGVHFIYVQFILGLYTMWYMHKYVMDKSTLKKFNKILFIYATLFITNFFWSGNSSIQEVITGLVLMPAISLLLYYARLHIVVTFIPFLLVTMYILYAALVLWQPLDDITYNSANYLSYYALLYSFPYYLACTKENKEPWIIVPIITVFVALLAMGRGGILASGLLLVFQLYGKINAPGYMKHIYRLAIVIIVGSVLYVGISDDVYSTLFSKFEEHGMDSRGRTDSYSAYLLSLVNPLYFLLGAKISTIPYIYKYLDGHIHTSWLTVHSRVGIYSVFILVCVVSGLIYLYKQKKYYVFAVLAALLFAGITNTDIGGTMVGGDLYMFYLVLLSIEYKKYKNYNSKIISNESKSISTISSSVSSCS